LKVDSYPVGKETPHFYETKRYIAMFINDHHWTLSWATWIWPTTWHPVSL